MVLNIPDSAIGAIAAAGIAAVIALLSLIVSKEQKISEFRQAWIDALREDLTSYVAGINQIVDTRNFTFSENQQRFEALSSQYLALNTSAFNIQLKINIHESRSQRLLFAMQALRQILLVEEYFDHTRLREAETALIASSQELLKAEWKRVKRAKRHSNSQSTSPSRF